MEVKYQDTDNNEKTLIISNPCLHQLSNKGDLNLAIKIARYLSNPDNETITFLTIEEGKRRQTYLDLRDSYNNLSKYMSNFTSLMFKNIISGLFTVYVISLIELLPISRFLIIWLFATLAFCIIFIDTKLIKNIVKTIKDISMLKSRL